jgi:hypothetical protein
VISTFQSNGIKVQGMDKIVEQQKVQAQQIPQGEDL